MLKPIIEEAGEAALTEGGTEHSAAFLDEVSPDLEVDADPEQLFRILLNLMRNAGETLRGNPAGQIRVTAGREGRHVSVEVADNGPGIPEKVRERLFQPFAGTARPGRTGLGLVISRDLARALA